MEAMEKLQEFLKSHIKDLKKYEKLKEKTFLLDTDNSSPKRLEKASSDLNWAKMALRRDKDRLHCLSVEAGLADVRDDAYYAEIKYYPANWYELNGAVSTPKQGKV